MAAADTVAVLGEEATVAELEERVKFTLQAFRGKCHLDDVRCGDSDDAGAGESGDVSPPAQWTAPEWVLPHGAPPPAAAGEDRRCANHSGAPDPRQSAKASPFGKHVSWYQFMAPSFGAFARTLLDDAFMYEVLRRKKKVSGLRGTPWQINPKASKGGWKKQTEFSVPLPLGSDGTPKEVATSCLQRPHTKAKVVMRIAAAFQDSNSFRMKAELRYQDFTAEETLTLAWSPEAGKVDAHMYVQVSGLEKQPRLLRREIEEACYRNPMIGMFARQAGKAFKA